MIRVEEINSFKDFLSIKEEWNDLLENSPNDMVFLRHEWIKVWWESFGRNKRLTILLARDKDELLAIAPLMYKNILKIGFIENSHTPRTDFILGKRPTDGIEAILRYLCKKNWYLLELKRIPATSPTIKILEDLTEVMNFPTKVMPSSYSTICIPITGTNWNEFYGSLSKKFRRNLKVKDKRLEELGEVRYERITNPTELNNLLNECFQVASRSWQGKKGTAISSRRDYHFYSNLAGEFGKKGWININLLKIDGKPLSFAYGVVYKKRLDLLKIGFDEEYSSYSPGRQLIKRVLEKSFEERLEKFDFTGPFTSWKSDWNPKEVKSHLVFLIYNKTPISKSIYFIKYPAKEKLKKIKVLVKLKRLFFKKSKGEQRRR